MLRQNQKRLTQETNLFVFLWKNASPCDARRAEPALRVLSYQLIKKAIAFSFNGIRQPGQHFASQSHLRCPGIFPVRVSTLLRKAACGVRPSCRCGLFPLRENKWHKLESFISKRLLMPLLFNGIRQPLIFPGRHQPSIVSRLCLNRRVRDGNGCVPQTHYHRKS